MAALNLYRKCMDEYQSLDELDDSLTHGSLSDFTDKDSYDYGNDIGRSIIKNPPLHYEDSMTAVLAYAQTQLEKRELSPTRVNILASKGRSSCVQMGGVTFVDFAGACINKDWANQQNGDLARRNALLYQKYYRGVLTMDKAEELCTTRSQWILYHRVHISLTEASRSYSEKRDLPPTSVLAIVYRRSDTGAHEHYLIRSKAFKHPDRHNVYYVDYGDLEAPHFSSIYGLLLFYDTNAYINVRDTRKVETEAFPLWNRAKPEATISEFSLLTSEAPSWIPEDTVFDATTISTFTDSDEASCDL